MTGRELFAKWRVGRSVGRTIYAMIGPEESVLIGVMDSPALAAQAVRAHNLNWALTEAEASAVASIGNAESVEEVLGLAVGAGSVCWESLEDSGIFQDGRATEIVRVALARISELVGGIR